jgi:hypothetical protein
MHVVLAGLIAAAALTQVSTSRLEGIIEDPSGAVVPGAMIVVENDTNGWPHRGQRPAGVLPISFAVARRLPDDCGSADTINNADAPFPDRSHGTVRVRNWGYSWGADWTVNPRIQSLAFRAEFYNLFNNPNFNNPSNVLSTPASFGKISSTASGAPGVPLGGTAGGPRIIQFVLRYEF